MKIEDLKIERSLAEDRYKAAQVDGNFSLMDMWVKNINNIDKHIAKLSKEETKQYVWITGSGNWLVIANSHDEVYEKIMTNRMKAGQTRKEAERWFKKEDQLLEIEGEL
jgi:hypothetical protein